MKNLGDLLKWPFQKVDEIVDRSVVDFKRRAFLKLAAKFGIFAIPVVSVAKIAGISFTSILREVVPAEPFDRTGTQRVYDETLRVQMHWDYGGSPFNEDLRITADLNPEENKIYLGLYTKNWDRQNWSGTELEKVPCNKRHTDIFHPFTFFEIFHENNIKIGDVEQVAHIVYNNNYVWTDDLKPLKDHPGAQGILEETGKIVDWLEDITPRGTYFRGKIEGFIEKAKRKREKIVDDMRRSFGENFEHENIQPEIPQKMGYTETAREYEIGVRDLDKGETSHLAISLNVYLGNPTKSSSNELPNRSGGLEGVVIPITLIGGEKKEEEEDTEEGWEKYFFNKKEAKGLERVTNPESGAHLSVRTDVYAYLGLELRNAGRRFYRFPNDPQSGINQDIQTFATKYQAQKFIFYLINKYLENFQKYLIFNKEDAVSFISFDLQGQKSRGILLDKLLMYEKRLGAEFYFPDCYRVAREEGLETPLSSGAFISSAEFAKDMLGKSEEEIKRIIEKDSLKSGKIKAMGDLMVYALIIQ